VAQGQVLQGDMAVSAAEEGKQSKQAEQEVTIEAEFSLDQPRQINHLAPDGVLAKDRLNDVSAALHRLSREREVLRETRTQIMMECCRPLRPKRIFLG
jgi:hypothetical protein